jgi:hypothetical protein
MWSGPMDFQPRSGVSAGVMTHRPPRASRCQAHHIPRGDSSSIRGAGTVLLCTRLRAAGRRR